MDVGNARAALLFQRYGLDYYTADAARITEDPASDLAFLVNRYLFLRTREALTRRHRVTVEPYRGLADAV